MTAGAPARLLVGTRNPGKLRELATLFAGLPLDLLCLTDLPVRIDEPEETGTTFSENARLKAVAYARASGLPCLADDSGFEVAALGGRPGVQSARVPGGDDEGRMRWVYARLDETGSRESEAAFVCAMAIASPEGDILHETEGRVEGRVAGEPVGVGGFGYDPMFVYPPAGRTFAEMTREEKAAVSHRGQAARRMRARLEPPSPEPGT
jgi:XTP/dITP diphosphohydrolase